MLDRASRFSLQNKGALVTGASRGIGAEIATVFADAGADVAIVGRDAEGLKTTKQAIAGKGRRCVEIQADLRTVDGARIAVTRAIEFVGTVNILVNNAGIFHRESLLETTIEHWDETQAVNLRAPFLLGAARRAWHDGTAAWQDRQCLVPGCPGWMRGTCRLQLRQGRAQHVDARHGCRIGAIQHPDELRCADRRPHRHGEEGLGAEEKSAPVKARIPLHRFGTPLEIADLVLFLASPASDFICGQVVFIDGGYSAV
jgi:NAD(P)-dependent dehydrogenase (short-subunit alcohol dehydrogenase family)